MVLVSIVRVEAPEAPGDSVTVRGLNDDPGPEGERLAVRVTVPENPFKLVKVIVDEFEAPAIIFSVAWLEETVKPGGGVTIRVIEVAFLTEPLTPFTVTV